MHAPVLPVQPGKLGSQREVLSSLARRRSVCIEIRARLADFVERYLRVQDEVLSGLAPPPGSFRLRPPAPQPGLVVQTLYV